VGVIAVLAMELGQGVSQRKSIFEAGCWGNPA